MTDAPSQKPPAVCPLLLATAMAALPCAAFVTDKKGVIVWANAGLSTLTLYTIDELVGRGASAAGYPYHRLGRVRSARAFAFRRGRAALTRGHGRGAYGSGPSLRAWAFWRRLARWRRLGWHQTCPISSNSKDFSASFTGAPEEARSRPWAKQYAF